MSFWKKTEHSENWKELVQLLELMRTTMAEHTAQISLINDKLLRKLSSSSLATLTHKEEEKETTFNDGFDEIRKINVEERK